MPKCNHSLTPIIRRQILDMLVSGTRPTEIARVCAEHYHISTRSVERHISAVRRALTDNVGSTIETIRATLHERYEQQYRDTQQVEDTVQRIDLQRKIAASHADLFGFGHNYRGEGSTTINIALLLPDSIREAIRPTVYDDSYTSVE